jgi:hypothetical protein
MIELLLRLVRRGLYYLTIGAGIGGLPLSLLSFLTITYYNITPLQGLFSNFYQFCVVGTVAIVAVFGMIGYAFKFKTLFWQAQIDVDVEANPYQNTKLVPNSIPVYEMYTEMCKKFELDSNACNEMKKLLINSGSKKYTEKDLE